MSKPRKQGDDPAVVRVPFRKLALATVSLPLVAFAFCVSWSFLWHRGQATRTHCRVWNFAPSISAAIGVLKPQKFVWKLCLGIHSAPRFLIAFLYFRRLGAAVPTTLRFRRGLIAGSFVLNVAENLSLLMLSFAPSKEDFVLHKVSFVSFLVCASAYMVTSLGLWAKVEEVKVSSRLARAWNLKARLVLTNFACIICATYFYYRHNRYCEPGVYSLFSLAEYGIVLTNIGFHFISYYDFQDLVFTIRNC